MRLLFFAHDSGGANAIAPLIESLKVEGNKVFVYAKGPALSKLRGSEEMMQSPKELLQKIAPDFLITGTSANDFTEKYLWNEAKKLNIRSLAILDHWLNYGIRFSKYGLRQIEEYRQNKTFDYLPDYICVMDDYAKEQMQNEGIPEKIILPMGNPHFQSLINASQKVEREKVREKFLEKGEGKLITFASEPCVEDYGSGREKVVLEHLLEITKNTGAQLLVKLHPKENFEKYKEYGVVTDKETQPMEVIMASDVVVSMTSMFLIESLILGVDAVSYQPEETDENKFILTKMKVLPFINSKKALELEINRIFSNKSRSKNMMRDFNIKLNAVENVTAFLDTMLCVKLI